MPRYFISLVLCLALTAASAAEAENNPTALRWTSAAMVEAAKGFRRLKACKQLPDLRAALAAHQIKHTLSSNIEQQAVAA